MAEISGVVARIEWSYYVAAAVNGYKVARDPLSRQWWVTGNLVDVDAFKVAQRPLFFVAPHAGGSWRWPIVGNVPPVRGPFAAKLGQPFEIGKPNVLVR